MNTRETKTDRPMESETGGTQGHGASGLTGGGSCGDSFFSEHGGSTNS